MKKLLSLLLSLALCLSILPTAAFAAEGSGNTASNKKISLRYFAKNGNITPSTSGGVQTEYGTTHTLTVTPQTGRYVIAGYFAGTDWYKTNPSKYEYESMTLNKINADASTGAVTYQFTATEVIPIENDNNCDYICLYFHCAKLPTLQWTLGDVSGEATAPSTDGNKAAIPYVSQKELCGDPNEYTGYYSLADETDRPYLDWQVISITDKEGNTAGGTVAFNNNHLTYTPTADEAGKTVTITIRPKLGYVEEANTPLSFEIEVKKPVVEQSEFYVTMVIDGYGNAVARPNPAKEREEIQLTAIPDRGHHLKEWQATSGTSGKIMITNDKFTMPAENVTVKAIFEADTYTVRLDANGGTIASGQDVTSYTYGVGATLPTKDDMTREGYTFDGWYDNNGFSGSSVTTISPTDTGAKTFYAKWTINSYSVTFNSNDGSDIDSQTVDYGDTVAEPTAPTKNGYTFAGWYSDEGLVSAYDFSTTVTSDITLYAKWTKNSSGGSYTPPTYKPTINQSDEGGTVSVDKTNPKKGDTVTITPNPDAGYEVGEITVTDRNGDEVEVTKNADGSYSFKQPAGKVTIAVSYIPADAGLSDVHSDSYYYDAVNWAAAKGITGGIGNGLFGPNQPCTRAQIVTFLWRAAGSPEPKTMSSFSDVSADSYYAKAVAWAVENGITVGTSSTTFSPDDTCTRAQSVTFLFRALGKLVDSKAKFSDVPTDSYYANAVAWAVENGVTNGIGNNLFGPDNSCTRAQIVTFLFRAYQDQ